MKSFAEPTYDSEVDPGDPRPRVLEVHAAPVEAGVLLGGVGEVKGGGRTVWVVVGAVTKHARV